MELSVTAGLWVALIATVVLAGLHLVAPRIRRIPFMPEAATGSFGGGLAVAYIFLHLLPDIADGNEAVGEGRWLHLGSFMVYNGLIGYTMPLRFRTGVGLPSCSASPWGCTSF